MEQLKKSEMYITQEVRVVRVGDGKNFYGKLRALSVKKIKIINNGCVRDWFWGEVEVYKAEPDIYIYYCDVDGCKAKADYFYEKDGKDFHICEHHKNESEDIDEGKLYILEQTELKLVEKKTERGFSTIEFKDRYNDKCSLQKSSLATENAIWFGIADPNPQIMASKTPQGGTGWVSYKIPSDVMLSTRMHLSQLQVRQLLPVLKHFAETGEVDGNPKS